MTAVVTVKPGKGGWFAHCTDCSIVSPALPEGAARVAATEHRQQHQPEGGTEMKPAHITLALGEVPEVSKHTTFAALQCPNATILNSDYTHPDGPARRHADLLAFEKWLLASLANVRAALDAQERSMASPPLPELETVA